MDEEGGQENNVGPFLRSRGACGRQSEVLQTIEDHHSYHLLPPLSESSIGSGDSCLRQASKCSVTLAP